MLEKYTDIFFDLDDTLTNPQVGITRAVQFSLEKMGIGVCD